MLSLFDKITTSDSGPAAYSEPNFSYLNRSGRPELVEARKTLDEWFSEYQRLQPTESKNLRARFRSLDDNHHLSALTELWVHQFVIDQGYTPKANPKLANNKTPDFLIYDKGLPILYLESLIIFDGKLTDRMKKFKNHIIDSINQLHSADFFISIIFESVDLDVPPPLNKIKQFLKDKISKLDYDQVCKDYEKSKVLPEWVWKDDKWVIKFIASPASDEGRVRRQGGSRLVGINMGQARSVRVDDALRKSVKTKARKYRNLSLPFMVIAAVVGEDAFFCDDYGIMCALFGQEILTFTTDGGRQPQHGRNLDGIFVHPKKGLINSGLNGLAVLTDLGPWKLKTVIPTLWHHPKPKHFLPLTVFKIPQKAYDPKSSRMKDV